MTAAACRAAWLTPGGHLAAKAIDAAFPQGFCEIFSLSDPERTPVGGDELVARILTTPGDFDAGQLLTAKLTNIYAGGLSLVRAGATDKEILDTINVLMSAKDVQGLYGAVIAQTAVVRQLGQPEKHFCIYDTDAPTSMAHADLVGTFDTTASTSGWRKIEKQRRYRLRDALQPFVVQADQPPALLAALREAGI